MSKKLKDSTNFNITKFSNKLYSEFKRFKNRIDDLDIYMKEIENKISKKYKGQNYLKYLKKKVYEDVSTISAEKYKSFEKIDEDIIKYEGHFKQFLKEKEDKTIIYDIIKMYLFIKDSIYESKFYENSNAKDFFEKFKNQIMVTKLFSEEYLKKLYYYIFVNEINTIFDIINLKILNDKINLKFSKEDFINAKDKLNQKLEKNQIIFQKLIDSKYQIMENEYNKLIKDFNDGNLKVIKHR